MRPPIVLLASLALVFAAGGLAASATPATASAPNGSSACGLPGLVRSASAGPCPATAPAADTDGGAQPDFSLGGWLLGGLLSQVVRWVDHGAADALRLTGSLLSSTTRPQLLSSWFTSTYARMATLSVLLTLPFLFAAAVHALVRSELALLGRAAFGYLPLAMLGVVIAAPLITLLLSATDEMCDFVASASGSAAASFLGRAALAISAAALGGNDPFLAFFVGLITVAATVSLWIELLIRGAAVEVVVLMLPLFFAAMVWPARRVWAVRAIEVLVALILSKLAIVSVLALGGAALGAGSGVTASLTGATLVLLAVLSPWALLRLLPLHEVAAAAAGGLSQGPRQFADTMRGAPFGRGGQSADQRDGLGPEDDRASALARMASAGSIGLDVALGTFGRSHRRSGQGGASRSTSMPPATADGLAAVEGAGSGGTSAPASAAGLDPQLFGAETRDDRPPIAEPFTGAPWEGFTLGEQGDEVMEPPRIVRGDSGGGSAPPAGPEGPPDAGRPIGDAGGDAPPPDLAPPPNLTPPPGLTPPPDVTPPPALGSEQP